MVEALKYAAAITVIVLAFGIVGKEDYEEELRQVQHYCEMVKINEQTNGRDGWPAYNGKSMCN
ncbi:hypothetical protein [Caudoviricetes sp.]|nr:hypothetical protein [Caudoviricetes sp.]